MPQNKNPIQERIEQERAKSGIEELTPSEIARQVGNLARAEGVRANKDKISQGITAAFADPVIKERHLTALKDFAKTPEHKAKNKRAAETRSAIGAIEKSRAATKALRADPVKSAELNRKSKEGLEKVKATAEYWENYYAGINKRDQDQDYHKRRIAASNAKIAIKIITPEGEFDSISDAARHYGLTSEGMRHRVNSLKYPDYKKIEK